MWKKLKNCKKVWRGQKNCRDNRPLSVMSSHANENLFRESNRDPFGWNLRIIIRTMDQDLKIVFIIISIDCKLVECHYEEKYV